MGADPRKTPAKSCQATCFRSLASDPSKVECFQPRRTTQANPGVVILSYGLWQRRFGGDAGAVGSAMTINGVTHTIVAVMPADFPHLYATPYSPIPQLWVSGIGLSPSGTWNDYMAIGPLKPGVGLRQAEAATESVSVGIEQMYPDLKGWRAELRTLREMNSGDSGPRFWSCSAR